MPEEGQPAMRMTLIGVRVPAGVVEAVAAHYGWAEEGAEMIVGNAYRLGPNPPPGSPEAEVLEIVRQIMAQRATPPSAPPEA